MTSPREEAEASQRAASDPAVSAFVAASAGSGKTRLLTDRLLRLMVGGAKPERILCLTFTKTAAAEMSLRLQHRLGLWVTMNDTVLAEQLRSLAIDPKADVMARARSLFALVLDLPGGMRISTIHAFCQSLLRRFPLEAALSPHFQLADDHDAAEVMMEAREATLAAVRPRGASNVRSGPETSLRVVASHVSLDGFTKLVTNLKESKARGLRDGGANWDQGAARRRILRVTDVDHASVIAASVRWPGEAALRDAAREVGVQGAPKVRKKAADMLDWLGLSALVRARDWSTWRDLFLKKTDGLPYSDSNFVNDRLAAANAGLVSNFVREAERVAAVEDRLRAVEVAAISDALLMLAGPLLERYEARKDASGLLEFADLIDRGTALLVDPGADWVLYKLDGGLDHLLLDEVQDTAPDQWKIADSLTREFFAGAGARDGRRTVFAVGDRKQSIFSFQGADVQEFEGARQTMRKRIENAGEAWCDSPLTVSFRSTPPILRLVDAVFADPIAAKGVVLPGEILRHRADREGQAGRAELWPLTEAPVPDTPLAWSAPNGYQRGSSAIQKLADDLANWIRDQTSGAVPLESKGRPLRPGDVLILVRRRDKLPATLVRSLKTRGIPVAGLDRMVLTSQPAVQDLMVLGDSLLLPSDDLSFAALLTSPLGGLNDSDLMALAIGRTKPLWEVLRDRATETPAWTRAWSYFGALLSRADFVSPHTLFGDALSASGGRARLLARLGPEAAEPIDEFLSAALRYATLHPPSLQGFLQWLRRSGAEIKREAEATGDHVRILTVHGAKGLQAPLVILPDTTGNPPGADDLFWDHDPVTGRLVPIWVPRADFHCAATRSIRDMAKARRMEEYNRLLYVALTRAEDRLLVCGAKPRKGVLDEACWYNLISRGMARLVDTQMGASAGAPVSFGTIQTAPRESEQTQLLPGLDSSPPPYLGTPPRAEPARPMPLAPSRPEGVDLGPVPSSLSPLTRVENGSDRFLRGQLIHALLQHLPALRAADRHAAARRFLERPVYGMSPEAAARMADETLTILAHPALDDVFGPQGMAEVPLTGVSGAVVIGGLVDRLLVLPDRVTVVDFKTNRKPPATIDATPVAYVRQMASYRAVLQTIFPGRPVECVLIWTRDAHVMTLPDALLEAHAPGGVMTDDIANLE